MTRKLSLLCFSSLVSCFPLFMAGAEPHQTILTENVVTLRETVSPQGFVHPGISCTAETLAVMREKVISGESPWVDGFEGVRRTKFADLKRRPSLVKQITNDGGIGALAHDAHLAWAHTILYVVTGNEDYRKTPLEIIRWYGSRKEESFFPRAFPDSHIKIGKYVYTLCSAVDILRSTTPRNPDLAVTPQMVEDLQKYCLYPIRKNCIEKNGYFMNQHSYAIMGYLASTILGDEVEDYQQAVEWTTVNATSPNQGRNGSIKEQIRLVTHDAKTGKPVEPRLQVVEMGRDQPHAGGNIDNLLMMCKTIEFQKTKVDPVQGTVTKDSNGVSSIRFLDNRLPTGAALFAKYNLGFGLEPWVSVFSETDPNHPDNHARYDQISYFGRGSGGGSGTANAYYFYRSMGLDLEQGPFSYIKASFDAHAVGREQNTRSGKYFDYVHNYAFDYWIGLPANASDTAPDPEKAKRALAVNLPPLEVKREGHLVEGQQFEHRFIDLSAHALPGDIYPGSASDKPLKTMRDADGTGYVRMTAETAPRTMVATIHFKPGAGLRLRSDAFVKLSFHNHEDVANRASDQDLYLPDTEGEWTQVALSFSSRDLVYIVVTPASGPAQVDFDRVVEDPAAMGALAFATAGDSLSIPSYTGAEIRRQFPATGAEGVTYNAAGLPAGAQFDAKTGGLTWTPAADQVGEHILYITAQAGETMRTLRVDIQVAKDLQAALDSVSRAYDPSQRYVTTTEEKFKAAQQSRDLDALKQAADALELLSPRLPDGTLDFRVASSDPERGVHKMADNDPLSWGGLWGKDKSVTLDFGNRFKVKASAFRLQARDGFPVRVLDSVVYGSNDRKEWTLLTEGKSKSSPDLQTLAVKPEEQGKAYRFLRMFMPHRAYGIFEVAEFRIVGERIEDPSPDYRFAYVEGFADGTFRPEAKLTKAEAATFLGRLADDYTDRGAYECGFKDVPKNAPNYEELAYMSFKGYIVADKDRRYHPEAPITRGELAAIMARMQNLKGKDGPNFKDVTKETPDAEEIRRVAREGWLTGDDSGDFHPEAPVTRAEFVVAANRMSGRKERPTKGMPTFSDVKPSHSAYGDIMAAATTFTTSGDLLAKNEAGGQSRP